MDRHSLVTGMHRSGTTMMGDIIRRATGNIAVLHEPLNFQLGIKGVPCWYPSACQPEARDLVSQILSLDVAYRRWVRLDESFARTMGRFLLGGAGSRSLVQAKRIKASFGDSFSLCVKDPFALLLTELFSGHGARSVVMVRHPAALYLSMRRMNWSFNFKHLSSLREHPLSERLDEAVFLAIDMDLPSQVGLLWKTLYFLASENAKNDERVMFVRHEDFCIRPFETISDVLNHLKLPSSPALIKEVSDMTSGSDANVGGKRLHNMKRDSGELAFSWKKYARDEEILKVKDSVGDAIQLFYRSWDEL
jgi:hypothetical protein